MKSKIRSSQLPPHECGGLQLNHKACHVRLVDSSPAPSTDVQSSDGIRMARETTRNTEEFTLRSAVRFGNMPAAWASAGSVAWINQHDRNSGELAFILNKAPKLIERPRMLDASLCLTELESLSDALEVFQSNTSESAFGLRNQPLADDVVDVSCEPGFLSAAFLEQPFGGFGLLGLESSPQTNVSPSESINRAAGVGFTFGVRGDVHDAQINADVVLNVLSRRLWNVYSLKYEDLAVAVHEVGFTLDQSKVGLMVGAIYVGDQQTTLKREDRDSIQPLPRQQPIVIDDGSMETESVSSFLIPHICPLDLPDSADGHLSRETKPLSNSIIGFLVEPNLAHHSQPERDLGDEIAGFVEAFNGFEQSSCLFRCRQQLYLDGEFHGSNLTTIKGVYQ